MKLQIVIFTTGCSPDGFLETGICVVFFIKLGNEFHNVKGSLKNKFAISDVQATGLRGVKTREYLVYSVFPQRCGTGCMGMFNVICFCTNPKWVSGR